MLIRCIARPYQRAADAAREGDVFEAVWWGQRLAAVRVRLAATEADELRELLADAWEGKVPAALHPARET
jgi:hypothetical protein